MSAELPAGQAFKSPGHKTDTVEQDNQDAGRFVLVLAGILICSAVAYFSLALNWPKFSRAEVFFAECVREMFQADNLVTPLYHGAPFFDKPILAYWFIAASYQIAGISHFSARVPSVLMGLGTIALTAFAGRRLFGAGSGILSAAILSSSLMFVSFACLCMSDMSLVFFDTASLSLLFLSLASDKRRSILLYLGSLSMGMAFLTKGPVGIVLPALSFAIFLSYSKQWHKIHWLRHVLPCTLILLGAGVPWFMAAFRQNGAGALSYFFIHENLQRFAGSTYDTHRPLWFMVQSLVVGMLPWSCLLPFAFVNLVRIRRTQKGLSEPTQPEATGSILYNHVYLWLWIVVVIGFFSLSRGKIDYYALPAYPAVAILTGNYLSAACRQKSRIASYSAGLISFLMFAGGLFLAFALPGVFAREGIGGWPIMPGIVLGSACLMFYFCLKRRFSGTFIMLSITISLLALAFSCQIYPWITSKQAVLKFIPYIRTLALDGRVGVHINLQNWIDEITFQTDREPMRIDKPRMAERFLQSSCPCLLLIEENDYGELSLQVRQNCHILAASAFIPRSLNPIYFIHKGQKLADNTTLLLVANFRAGAR